MIEVIKRGFNYKLDLRNYFTALLVSNLCLLRLVGYPAFAELKILDK